VVKDVDLRILQANERTLLAWIRTGLALMAFGLVLSRIVVWLRLEHPDRASNFWAWLGLATLAIGTACHVVGAIRFVRARRAIIAGEPIHPSAAGPVAAAALVGSVGVVAIAYLLTEL
jgi:putative membrane protein